MIRQRNLRPTPRVDLSSLELGYFALADAEVNRGEAWPV